MTMATGYGLALGAAFLLFCLATLAWHVARTIRFWWHCRRARTAPTARARRYHRRVNMRLARTYL